MDDVCGILAFVFVLFGIHLICSLKQSKLVFSLDISDLPSHVISKAGRSSSITRVSAQSKAAGARVNRGFLIAAVILEEFTAFQSSTTGSRTRRENAVQSL